MTTYAAAIAARLQGRGREDEDMAGRTRKTDGVGDPWESMAALFDQLRDHCVTLIRERDDLKALRVQRGEGADAGRVAELERQLEDARGAQDGLTGLLNGERGRNDVLKAEVAELKAANEDLSNRHTELERELETVREQLLDREQDLEKERERAFGFASNHADCYVAREVPWSDVAAGMMTIARDGTPWMVEGWAGAGDKAVLRNGQETFIKTPADGETVRVLVPYVTDEQAEGLVSSVLGGTEVG